MIMVAGSLAIIGIIGMFIADDVLFGDNIQREKTRIYQECDASGDFDTPQCEKFKRFELLESCQERHDTESPECWKYRMWVEPEE